MKRGTSVTILALLFAHQAQVAAPTEISANDVRYACNTNRKFQKIPGVIVTNMAAEEGGLPYLEIRIKQNSSATRLYYESGLLPAAQAKATCIGGLLSLLGPEIPDSRTNIQWASVALLKDENSAPAKLIKGRHWNINLPDSTWTPKSTKNLILVIPHEEVHQSQDDQKKAELPRWFAEGHAEWVGLKVTGQVRPDYANEEREDYLEKSKSSTSLNLQSWGGIRPKKEAIERQLSPQDRDKLASDPNFRPNVAFTFGPDDFTFDNDNELGRYGASLSIFLYLEEKYGVAMVRKWVSAVLSSPNKGQAVTLAKSILGEDLEPRLK